MISDDGTSGKARSEDDGRWRGCFFDGSLQLYITNSDNWVRVLVSHCSGTRPAADYFANLRCDSGHPIRVPGLPIRDRTRGCDNCVHTRQYMSAICVTEETFFEHLC